MYYDIDDIETDSQRVPSTFTVSLPHLGHLNGSERDLEEGTRLSLPLWLATPLSTTLVDSTRDEAFVALEEPAAFAEDVLNALRSDPVAVDLREQSPVFTNLALRWLAMFDSPLAGVLYDAVRLRMADIYDCATARRGMKYSYDEYERQLYRMANAAARNYRAWLIS